MNNDTEIDVESLSADTAHSYLDLFSTSPTTEDLCLDFLPEKDAKCYHNAPHFAYQIDGRRWAVVQGCCNHWDCPKCGIKRAKQEYGRIVEGCRQIAKNSPLYFITLTCKGEGLSVKNAQTKYLYWTNRLLDACRARARRAGKDWIYCQVTERQRRGHPHSHVLTTFDVGDLQTVSRYKWKVDAQGVRRKVWEDALRSKWFEKALHSAGLGSEYDISAVQTVEGASRYVAKYMFKDTMFQAHWPKGWRRVRYSQSFPKLAERDTNAMALLSREDWANLAKLALYLHVKGDTEASAVYWNMRGHDTFILTHD